MAGFKNQRLAEDIKREISGVMREQIKDPRVSDGLSSVVKVDLSGDNSHCKVYISHIDGIERAKEVVKGLESAAWMIRSACADKLHLKKCPEFKFIADDSIERSADLLQKINALVPPENNEEE